MNCSWTGEVVGHRSRKHLPGALLERSEAQEELYCQTAGLSAPWGLCTSVRINAQGLTVIIFAHCYSYRWKSSSSIGG